MRLNHESNRYEQTQDQRETGVRLVPAVKEPPRQLIEVGGRNFGKAQAARNEILKNAEENFARAQLHLVEGIDWLEITGMIDSKMQERHDKLKRLISDILESVEGLRHVHSSTL